MSKVIESDLITFTPLSDGKVITAIDVNGVRFVPEKSEPDNILHSYIKVSHEDQLSGRESYYRDIDLTALQLRSIAEMIQAWVAYVTNPTKAITRPPSYELDMDKAIGLSITARKMYQDADAALTATKEEA